MLSKSHPGRFDGSARVSESPTYATILQIGPRVRALREHRGMSAAGLGEASGLSRATITGIERGTRTPTLDTLVRVADALGLELAALLDDRALPDPTAAPPGPGDPDEPGVLRARRVDLTRLDGQVVDIHHLAVTGPWRRDGDTPGGRGYLTMLGGRARAGSAATPRTVGPGDQVPFALDRPHMIVPLGGPVTAVLVRRWSIPEGDSGR